MLRVPENLPEEAWQRRSKLAEELIENLTSTEGEMYEKYFIPWSGHESVPDRAGYFIGFVTMNELAQAQPLDALLKPSGEAELAELIQRQLGKLAALPDDAYLSRPPIY